MTAISHSPFDYSELCSEDRQFVHEAAVAIRNRWVNATENVLAIGKHLTEVKARLTHGQFGRWLAAEFRWSDRHARTFMSVYEWAGEIGNPISDLAIQLEPTAVYQLAAPSTPEPARQEVLAKVEAGERVTSKAVKAIVNRHKPAKRTRTKTVDGDREPAKPKYEVCHDVRLMIHELLAAIPKNFDSATWALDMPSFLRKNTVRAIQDLRGRLLILQAVLSKADGILEAEPTLAPPEPTEELAAAAPGNGVETPEADLSPTAQWMRDHPDDKPCPRDPSAAAAWRRARGIQPPMKDYTCLACQEPFQGPVQRGQPPKFCPSCRTSAAARKKAKDAMREAAPS
jgi:hypothetical protein